MPRLYKYSRPGSSWAATAAIIFCAAIGGAQAKPANVELLSIAPENGLFRYFYALDLADTEGLSNGDYFTVYDFNGFAGGFQSPSDFTGSSSLFGPTPWNVIPVETAVPNLTFTYTGTAPRSGQRIEGLSALSTFGTPISGTYTALTTDTGGRLPGPIGSIGPTRVPSGNSPAAIPEPGTAALLGLGLLTGILPLTRRRRA